MLTHNWHLFIICPSKYVVADSFKILSSGVDPSALWLFKISRVEDLHWFVIIINKNQHLSISRLLPTQLKAAVGLYRRTPGWGKSRSVFLAELSFLLLIEICCRHIRALLTELVYRLYSYRPRSDWLTSWEESRRNWQALLTVYHDETAIWKWAAA